MRKNLSLLFIGLSSFVWVSSQQLSPSIIASAGETSKAAGISLEWTLGEVIIETRSTSDRLYTQGFHQPLLLAKSFHPLTHSLVKGFQVSVAPNPVQSVLNTSINSVTGEKVFLTIIDFTGRRYNTQVAQGKISSTKTDMSNMIAGMYLMEIRNSTGELIQSFKIIKAQ